MKDVIICIEISNIIFRSIKENIEKFIGNIYLYFVKFLKVETYSNIWSNIHLSTIIKWYTFLVKKKKKKKIPYR